MNSILKPLYIGCLLGLLVLSPNLWPLPSYLRVAITVAAGGGLALAAMRGRASERGRSLTMMEACVLLGVFTFFGYKILRDFVGEWPTMGFLAAAFYGFDACLLVCAAIGTHWIFGKGEESEKMLAWSIAFALFSLANIVGYKIGYTKAVEETASLTGIAGGRLDPPFGFGRNSSGVMMAIGVLLGLCSLLGFVARRSGAPLVLTLFSIGASLLLIVLTETRSTLVPIVFWGLWLVFSKRIFRQMVFVFAAVAWIVIPPMSLFTNVMGLVLRFVPEVVWSRFSRDGSDLYTFAGRTSIWSYGYTGLQQDGLTLLGEGLEGRDTRAIFIEEFLYDPGANTSYHNGFLDILFVYGGVFGVVGVVAVLAGCAIAFSRIGGLPKAATASHVGPPIGVLGSMLLCCILDSTMSFTYFWPPFVLVLFTILSGKPAESGYSADRVRSP